MTSADHSAQRPSPAGAVTGGAPDPPGSLDAVLARMRALRAALPPPDGVRVFNDVYLSVTEELRRRLAGGRFADPGAAAELTVVFAARYLAAVDAAGAGRPPPACWRPLFSLRRHPGVYPLQFALAGINAHIGHDLALAVVDTCLRLGAGPERVADDYRRVGDVLAASEARIREELMPGPDPLDAADPLTHLAGCWSLDKSRDAAWAAARVLWGLRELPEIREEFAERLDRTVGMVSRCLLTPLRPGP